MRRVLRFDAADLFPPPDVVLASQGIPGHLSLPANLTRLLAQATDLFLRLTTARAVVEDISGDEFEPIYAGDGRNEARTPVGDIHPRAARRALFVATLGQGLSEEISRLFAGRDFALAHQLDAVASAAADLAAERAALDVLETTQDGDRLPPDCRALAYSPGYCGWHLSGQRKLFQRLRPETIGVGLNESFLMQPLKSVSGVILIGPPETHKTDETYACCTACRPRTCRQRLAAPATLRRS